MHRREKATALCAKLSTRQATLAPVISLTPYFNLVYFVASISSSTSVISCDIALRTTFLKVVGTWTETRNVTKSQLLPSFRPLWLQKTPQEISQKTPQEMFQEIPQGLRYEKECNIARAVRGLRACSAWPLTCGTASTASHWKLLTFSPSSGPHFTYGSTRSTTINARRTFLATCPLPCSSRDGERSSSPCLDPSND